MISRKSATAICVAPVFFAFSSSIAVPPRRRPRNSLRRVSCSKVDPLSGQQRRGVSVALLIRVARAARREYQQRAVRATNGHDAARQAARYGARGATPSLPG